MRTLENALRRVGFVYVAGVDEVGRGCLAGPVVAAAVVLHPDKHIPGVCDSKAVQAIERERLYEKILKHAVAWAVAGADPLEIAAFQSRGLSGRRVRGHQWARDDDRQHPSRGLDRRRAVPDEAPTAPSQRRRQPNPIVFSWKLCFG